MEEEIKRKRDLELFLNSLMFEYESLFNEKLGIEEIIYFCSLCDYSDSDFSYKKTGKKLSLKDCCSFVLNKVYPMKKCDIFNKRILNEEKIKYLKSKYVYLSYLIETEYGNIDLNNNCILNGLCEKDLKFIFYAYLMPYRDMMVYNDEREKSYVDLDSLINYMMGKYNVSYDEVCDRLNDVGFINNIRVLK